MDSAAVLVLAGVLSASCGESAADNRWTAPFATAAAEPRKAR